MKYNLFILTILLFASQAQAQLPDLSAWETPKKHSGAQSYGQLLGNISPLRDMVNSEEVMNVSGKIYEKKNHFKRNYLNNPNSTPLNGDPLVVQNQEKTTAKLGSSVNIVENFDGLRDGFAFPPDPTGDVGENHYLQAVNTSSGSKIRAWKKDGTPAMNSLNTSQIWSEVGSGSIGDPIVQYDQDAKRWILIEMQGFGNSELLLAISDNEDPTGSWKAYRFQTQGFPDYPKFYVWNNAYILTVNEIIGGNKCSAFALERSKILAGAAEFGVQRFEMPNFAGINYQPATGADWEGGPPPPPNSPGLIFRVYDNSWSGGIDHLEIWKIFLNWTTPALSSLDGPFIIPTTPFETVVCYESLFDCLEQPDPNAPRITALDDIIMYRVPYRNFGTYEAVVLNHVSDISSEVGPGGDAGVRWYELRKYTGNADWEIYQEGTYAPDLTNRFTGTISIDATGNIGLGYSVVDGTSTYPGLRVTGRRAGDLPLGQMTVDEYTLVDGGQSHESQRWGDYSSMSVDPVDGKTFWFTAEYQPANANWGTRIAAFTLRRDTFDMRPQGMNAPISSALLTNSEPVKVTVFNEGIIPAENVTVTLKFEGTTLATENIVGAIPAGQSIEHTFSPTVDMSIAGKNYAFDLITQYEFDQYDLNDSIRLNVKTLTSNDAAVIGKLNLSGVICSSEHPVGLIIRNAAGLPLTSTNIHYYINNQPVTNLIWTGYLLPGEKDTVILPLAGITNGQNFLNAYTDQPNTLIDQDRANDTLRVKFVGSLNGSPLLVKGFSNQGQLRWEIRDKITNQIVGTGELTSGQEKETNLCLIDDKCYKLKLRAQPIDWFGNIEFYDQFGNIFFQEDDFGGEETFEFCVAARKMIDVGAIEIISPFSSPNLSATESVKIRVRNFGETPQTDLPIRYRIDGGAWVSETLTGTLQQGESQEHVFLQTTDLSITGKTYLLEIETALSTDEAPENNAKSSTILNRANLDVAVKTLEFGGDCSELENVEVFFTFKNLGIQKIDSFRIRIQSDNDPAVEQTIYQTTVTDEIGYGSASTSFANFGTHVVKIKIIDVNAQGLDFDASNDSISQTINVVPNLKSVNLFLQFDTKPEETTWELLDNQGNIKFSGGPYTDTLNFINLYWCLPADSCYIFKLKDSGNDGLIAYVSLIADNNSVFESFGSNFGAETGSTFCLGVVSTEEVRLKRNLEISPNPSNGIFRLSLPAQSQEREAVAEIYDARGQFLYATRIVRWNDTLQTQISLEKYPAGAYFVRVKGLDRNYFGKLSVVR
jgi:Secretion system C-terminal sorting domain